RRWQPPAPGAAIECCGAASVLPVSKPHLFPMRTRPHHRANSFTIGVCNPRPARREVLDARSLRKWVVTLARPLVDAAGQLRGVVTVGTVLEHFQDALRVKDLPDGSVVSIINQDGDVIARSVDSAKWVGRNVAKWPSIARHLAAKEGSEPVMWPDGIER